MADTSSTNSSDLPEEEIQQDNPTDGGNEDSEGLSTDNEQTAELDAKTKKGFQRLVAKKDEQIKEFEGKLDKYNQELAKYRQQEREKKLENLSETEKWKTIAKENAQKAAEARLGNLVTQEAAKRGISDHPVVELLLETPWAIPAVRKRLTEDATWDETIELVKTHLPAYLDMLVVPEKSTPQNAEEVPSEEEEVQAEGMETERSGPTETRKRSWTREEVKKYLDEASGKPDEYKKRRVEITNAMNEGRIQ